MPLLRQPSNLGRLFIGKVGDRRFRMASVIDIDHAWLVAVATARIGSVCRRAQTCKRNSVLRLTEVLLRFERFQILWDR